MKKLVISGSSKLHERALYWRGYFEGRGYDVIDWPCPISTEEETLDEPQTEPGLSLGRWLSPSDSDYATRMTKIYKRFYKNLDQADTFFLMNEDKDGIEGYIGASAIAELTYVVTGNLNRGKKVEINILKLPSKSQNCYDEVKFWLDQDWIKIYHRPTGKKATIPVPDDTPEPEPAEPAEKPELVQPVQVAPAPTPVVTPVPVPEPTGKRGLFGRHADKSLDITTCKDKSLKSLTHEAREYLKVLCPEFPAWLLKYIAAPEFQRLSGVSMVSMDYSALYNFSHFSSVFQHSIGVALIIWNFTRDKKQTLAGLFHDIASPAFKHSIDYMNGDSETQESIEKDTGKIIRESKVITRQLKKDNILPSEVSDYHIYPIADNDVPNLAADRLEYTFSNGYFLYDTWTLDQIKTFYADLTILKNENDLDEIGFQTPSIAADFVTNNLTLSANYHGDKARATLQFLGDMMQSMINSGYLNMDDLYVMSEREIIDWILSCGDKPMSDAFRNFQRSTTVYSGATAKKNCYCISVKSKVRYITPLVLAPTDETVKSAKDQKAEDSAEPKAVRITSLDKKVKSAVDKYLDDKQSKYVGFDFDFKPYTAEA